MWRWPLGRMLLQLLLLALLCVMVGAALGVNGLVGLGVVVGFILIIVAIVKACK